MITVDSCSSIWRSLSRSLAFIDARLLLVIDEAYDDAGRSSIDRFARLGKPAIADASVVRRLADALDDGNEGFSGWSDEHEVDQTWNGE